jgi:hypothetical protein
MRPCQAPTLGTVSAYLSSRPHDIRTLALYLMWCLVSVIHMGDCTRSTEAIGCIFAVVMGKCTAAFRLGSCYAHMLCPAHGFLYLWVVLLSSAVPALGSHEGQAAATLASSQLWILRQVVTVPCPMPIAGLLMELGQCPLDHIILGGGLKYWNTTRSSSGWS